MMLKIKHLASQNLRTLQYFQTMDNTFDSDDDSDLLRCVENVEKKESDSISDDFLFIRQDGLPMYFSIQEDESGLKQRIEEKGGVLLTLQEEVESSYGGHTIRLCNDNLHNMKSEVEQFDKQFIDDCLTNNKIMELGYYRINYSSIYEEYDPMDILLGLRAWDQIQLNEEFHQDEMNKTEEDCNRVNYIDPSLDDTEDLITEDDIERRGSYCVEEPPTEWEIMTEDEALSFGISYEKDV